MKVRFEISREIGEYLLRCGCKKENVEGKADCDDIDEVSEIWFSVEHP